MALHRKDTVTRLRVKGGCSNLSYVRNRTYNKEDISVRPVERWFWQGTTADDSGDRTHALEWSSVPVEGVEPVLARDMAMTHWPTWHCPHANGDDVRRHFVPVRFEGYTPFEARQPEAADPCTWEITDMSKSRLMDWVIVTASHRQSDHKIQILAWVAIHLNADDHNSYWHWNIARNRPVVEWMVSRMSLHATLLVPQRSKTAWLFAGNTPKQTDRSLRDALTQVQAVNSGVRKISVSFLSSMTSPVTRL